MLNTYSIFGFAIVKGLKCVVEIGNVGISFQQRTVIVISEIEPSIQL